jgi:hypothetical protein
LCHHLCRLRVTEPSCEGEIKCTYSRLRWLLEPHEHTVTGHTTMANIQTGPALQVCLQAVCTHCSWHLNDAWLCMYAKQDSSIARNSAVKHALLHCMSAAHLESKTVSVMLQGAGCLVLHFQQLSCQLTV